MEKEWYVTFKVKHENAGATGKLYDYYAVKCDYKAQTNEVCNTLSVCKHVQYPRVVHGCLNTTGSRKRNVISFNTFIIMKGDFENA